MPSHNVCMTCVQFCVETKARNKNANSKVFDYNMHLQHGMDTEMPTHLARNLSNKEKKHITI